MGYLLVYLLSPKLYCKERLMVRPLPTQGSFYYFFFFFSFIFYNVAHAGSKGERDPPTSV